MVQIKTLIELFDTCQIENVISALRFLPEKIVFVGFKEVMTPKRTHDLESFFKLRNINVLLDYRIVGRYDYDGIYNKLNEILDSNEDCCFDLTGGKELVLAAMGAVSAMRNIPMIQINVRTGNLIRVKNCDNIIETHKSVMTVNESIVLNGGSVARDNKEEFCWELSDDFKKDIDIIWDICRQNCGLWNRQSKVFESFEKFGTLSEDFAVRVNMGHMKKAGRDTMLNSGLISKLLNNALISEYTLDDDVLSFKYKNKQVHQCITKAGNILELLVYKTAKEIAFKDPSYYDDIDIGVIVDWDGIIHDGTTAERDTRNEIDVVLMRDLVPVFISCKNGEVHKEALYELSTVAERFGGEYAKKILLTSYVSTDSERRKHILQRARDMHIDVIDGVDKMKKEEFIYELKKRAK